MKKLASSLAILTILSSNAVNAEGLKIFGGYSGLFDDKNLHMVSIGVGTNFYINDLVDIDPYFRYESNTDDFLADGAFMFGTNIKTPLNECTNAYIPVGVGFAYGHGVEFSWELGVGAELNVSRFLSISLEGKYRDIDPWDGFNLGVYANFKF